MDLTGITQTLSQTAAFTRLCDALAGGSARITAGVADAAKAAAVAAVALGRETPVLVLTSKEDRADRLAEELGVWLGASVPILTFPERDALPYERLAPASDTLRDRLQVLAALRERRSAIIVACALAVAQRTLSPTEARESIHRLHAAGSLNPETFFRDLVALGYGIEPVVQQPGRPAGVEASSMSSADCELPVRIELMGREIELAPLRPETRRSVRTVDGSPSAVREILLNRLDLKPLAASTPAPASPKPDALRRRTGAFAWRRSPGGVDFYVPFLARATLLDHLRLTPWSSSMTRQTS
jgi:transcription-repair coupling factor (superfamily II helicase)